MRLERVVVAGVVLVIGLVLFVPGCERPGPVEGGGAGSPAPAPAAAGARIRPATAPVEATPEAVEEAFAQMKRQARDARRAWEAKTFEEFERGVFKEPFDDGKYVVSGDIAIADRKQLEEFFETRIKQEPPETVFGQLVVHRAGGQDAVWNSTQKRQLTYCVSTGFEARHASVVADIANATGAWEQVADVDFMHAASQDGSCNATNNNVVFDVRPVNVNGQYLARAFFPNEPRPKRNVLIDESSFQLDPGGRLQLVGILRHELGHTLGWRHEHTRPESGTCFEDSNWRPLTAYDRMSVMHYPQCNGGGDWSLTLTAFDQNGAACLYGPALGFTVDPQICASPAQPPISGCRQRLEVFNDERVALAQERAYGPFAVSAGTQFEAGLTGSGTSPGDPDLYVRFGEAPSRTGGQFACRPYLSGPAETCALDVPAGQSQAFVMVHGYAAGTYNLAVTFTSGS